MSECSGPFTTGTAEKNRTGSVGTVMDGLKGKIHEPDEDGNGEVCTIMFNLNVYF